MEIEDIRTHCLNKPFVTEGTPFDETTLVFKVMDKMYALFNIESFESINLKCDPEKALELRAEYEGIKAGWHMNKKHWNTVSFYSDVDSKLLLELIDHSYDCVVESLPKYKQKMIQEKL